MKWLVDWIDHRTGLRNAMHEALFEQIPGGARWRYVWGSTLVFAFVTQAITGTFLWMAYSPSAQTAWESVFYIQYEMQGGWLLRGIHHFMAQAMVVLLALHLMQVVIDGAYRAPREFNFWIGLILMNIVLGLSLTGYLLPWDQKGYWATQVATKLMGVVPVVGVPLQKLVVGGPSYGHHTLTRFFALHAGVLPALLVGFLVLHIAVFRRHGIHAKQPAAGPDCTFWPDQVLKDAVACLAVLCVVLLLVVWPALMGRHGDVPGAYLGADLGAPADPASAYSAARPEWYFLFLFQFLKFFHGEQAEFIGAVVIPGAVMGFLFLMPFLGHWNLGHRFNVGMVGALLLGIAGLTGMALQEDYRDPEHRAAVAEAHELSQRALELARSPGGIAPEGAVALLRQDSRSQGPKLFAQHCGSCHVHQSLDAELPALAVADTPQGAPNLRGFASRAWLAGLLNPEKIDGPHYFGRTSHREGEMAGFVKETVAGFDDEQKHALASGIAALSAQAALPMQQRQDAQDQSLIATGQAALKTTLGCTDCHRFQEAGELGQAPDLTDYGSRNWLIGLISNPSHERYYGEKNDRMPAFAADEATRTLTAQEVELLADWLREDWYRSDVAPTATVQASSIAPSPPSPPPASEPLRTERPQEAPAATDAPVKAVPTSPTPPAAETPPPAATEPTGDTPAADTPSAETTPEAASEPPAETPQDLEPAAKGNSGDATPAEKPADAPP